MNTDECTTPTTPMELATINCIRTSLKQKLGFKGFVISDWEALDRLSEPFGSNYRDCVKMSVNAGVDMVMFPFKHEPIHTRPQKSGGVRGSTDDAVERILRVKFVAGLLEHPLAERSLLPTAGLLGEEHKKLCVIRKYFTTANCEFDDATTVLLLLLLCINSSSSSLHQETTTITTHLRKTKAVCDLPPSPPSLPIIGHLHLLLSLLIHKNLQKLSFRYGPLLHLRVFNVPIVLVSSASIAYEIFKAQDVNVSTRNLPTNEGSLFFGSLGFVTAPYGDYWKFMKKLMVTNLLGPQALERSREIRKDEVDRFYSDLLDKAMKKESVGIGEEAVKLINNIICKMLMGRSCSEENGEAEKVRGLLTETDSFLKKFFVAAIFRRSLGISLFKKALTGVSLRYNEVLEKILEEYEEKLDQDQSSEILDVLLQACRDETITRNHIKSLFVDLFVAGTDTSAHTVEWTMAEIFSNPNVHERLREEIDSVVGKTRLIQEMDLPNLPYLQAVVKEGLRLHPTAPLVVRSFGEGCKIRGFHVTEKTTLVVNGYAVMRDPDVWGDPEEFKPERFLASSRSGQEEEIAREEILKYIPFGSGRRGCPGANLAYVYVGNVIGVMVQCFDWKIQGDKINMNEAVGALSLTMAHPLKCTPVPRTLFSSV
ncbi:unnamed protein product [Microthlaspi erraticum]|uniref:Glycoside hydrolase family 3 N-terminal domain-containing protein n=1 Tax=Microthlaspi erraticum TaxID=1685480 RepID=A0A6D2IKF2_9BRAS|nr:unnamed protein product [Microthlaspi erraticum]